MEALSATECSSEYTGSQAKSEDSQQLETSFHEKAENFTRNQSPAADCLQDEAASSEATTSVAANHAVPTPDLSVEIVNSWIKSQQAEHSVANDTPEIETPLFLTRGDSKSSIPTNDRHESLKADSPDENKSVSLAIFDYSTTSVEVAIVPSADNVESFSTNPSVLRRNAPHYDTSISAESIEIAISKETAAESVVDSSKTNAITTLFAEPKQQLAYSSGDVSLAASHHLEVVCAHNSVSALGDDDDEDLRASTSVDEFLKTNQARLQADADDSFHTGCFLSMETTLAAALPRAFARLPKVFSSCASVHGTSSHADNHKKLGTIAQAEAEPNEARESSPKMAFTFSNRSSMSAPSNNPAEEIEELETMYVEEESIGSKSSRSRFRLSKRLFRRDSSSSRHDANLVGGTPLLDLKDNNDLTDMTESTPSTQEESSISSQPLMGTDDPSREEGDEIEIVYNAEAEERNKNVSSGKELWQSRSLPRRLRRGHVKND